MPRDVDGQPLDFGADGDAEVDDAEAVRGLVADPLLVAVRALAGAGEPLGPFTGLHLTRAAGEDEALAHRGPHCTQRGAVPSKALAALSDVARLDMCPTCHSGNGMAARAVWRSAFRAYGGALTASELLDGCDRDIVGGHPVLALARARFALAGCHLVESAVLPATTLHIATQLLNVALLRAFYQADLDARATADLDRIVALAQATLELLERRWVSVVHAWRGMHPGSAGPEAEPVLAVIESGSVPLDEDFDPQALLAYAEEELTLHGAALAALANAQVLVAGDRWALVRTTAAEVAALRATGMAVVFAVPAAGVSDAAAATIVAAVDAAEDVPGDDAFAAIAAAAVTATT